MRLRWKTGRPRGILLVTVVLLLGAWTTSPPSLHLVGAAPSVLEAVSALRTDLAKILLGGGGRWRSARWSVLVVSLDSGDTLFAENPGDPLAPASNMKLLTTSTALQTLGPDFRYQTFLLADGAVEGGRIVGDLILYGTGDPGISDRFQPRLTTVFEAFADSLLAQGITRVEGDLIGDGSYFEGASLGEGWSPEDLNDWFAAPSGGLVLGESVFTLRIMANGRAGGRPEIQTLPPAAGVPLENRATMASGGGLRVRRDDPSQSILVEGSIAPGRRDVWRQMTVQDPAHFAASVLRDVLREKGVQVQGDIRVVKGRGASSVTGKRVWAPFAGRSAPRVLARHVSPPLQEYLTVINKRSHNFLADQVFRTVGRITAGDGSFEGGARSVIHFMAGVPGVESRHLSIHDGSGLSALDRVSASDFVALTRYMAESDLWDALWETLPEAGSPSGLHRMYRTAAQGNLRAKTGTIDRVSALSGMVRSGNGERIAFSILSNQVPSTSLAKRIEDRIGTRLASFQRPLAVVPATVALRRSLSDDATGEGPSSDGSARTREAVRAPVAPGETHVIRPGENLTLVARQYGITLGALRAANPNVRPQHLIPGNTLKIPSARGSGGAEGGDVGAKRHQVRKGENLSLIARSYRVTVPELLRANPGLPSKDRLQIGQWLSIPARGGGG